MFKRATDFTLKTFTSVATELWSFEYPYIYISSTQSHISVAQKHYFQKLELLQKETRYIDVSCFRYWLSLIMHTSQDICCTVPSGSEVRKKCFNTSHILAINKFCRGPAKSFWYLIELLSFEKGKFRINAHGDFRFANREALKFELGYFVLLGDDIVRRIIQYYSKNSRIIVWSLPGGEVYAFDDAFDCFCSQKQDLKVMLQWLFPLYISLDSIFLSMLLRGVAAVKINDRWGNSVKRVRMKK